MTTVPRPLILKDLPGLLAVQRDCYGDSYLESAVVYERRLASPAQCSLVMEHEGGICAYCAAYDSLAGNVTPLHGAFESAEAPDTLYLHDMAVLPALAGQGLAAALLAQLWRGAVARGLKHSALVAVEGSKSFWEHKGYAAHPLQDSQQRHHLAGYGQGALYMQRRLANG